MTAERQACGIGAFLPMSCRGRAEAFARRLQTRLQHLGGNPGDDQGSENEETWLTNQAHYPTIHQPRLSSSSESDIFFDFDVDLESPGSGSPQEEATEDIHLNSDAAHGCKDDNTESGCVSALNAQSPGSDSSDGNYYDTDPLDHAALSSLATLTEECDDADVVTCNGHKDCDIVEGSNGIRGAKVFNEVESRNGDPRATTSRRANETGETVTDSDTTDFIGAGGTVENGYFKCNGTKCGDEGCCEASELEPEEQGVGVIGKDCNEQISKVFCTTFVHTTERVVECPGGVGMGLFVSRQTCVPEEGEGGTTLTVEEKRKENTGSDRSEENGHVEDRSGEICKELLKCEMWCPVEEIVEEHATKVENEEENCLVVEDCDGVNNMKVEDVCNLKEKESKVINEYETSEENVEKNCKKDEKSREVTNENDTNIVNNAENCNLEDVKLASDTREEEKCCKTEEKESNEAEICPIVVSVSPNVDECASSDFPKVNEMCQTDDRDLHLLIAEYKLAPNAGHHSDDDIDDDDSPPRRVQRCSSLKTGKTPPGTPGRKKIVRFADVLGLDLADVRTFLDEIPKVPTSAYEDLPNADLTLGNSTSTSQNTTSMPLCSFQKADRSLVPLFQQPGGCPDFLDRVRFQYVCLENAMVKDMLTCTITGTVRVLNLDFYKSVHIRYTLDSWKNLSDLQATYVANSCDGFSDTFSFVLYANTLKVGQRLEFAVRFQCHGNQYWDSNHGMNYVFQCLPPASPAPSLSLPCEGDRWASFY